MRTKIHELNSSLLDQILAWARYLSWCDMHRGRLDRYDERTDDGTPDVEKWYFIALLTQWYASLWVVIEGWQQIPFADPEIDDLIDSSPRFCGLLKRFRNGVYHFQPNLLEPRLIDFLEKSDVTMLWARLLHHEFLRFFWELLDSIPGEDNKQNIRDSVREMIGWLPIDAFEEPVNELQNISTRAFRMLSEAGDTSSPAAVDLLQAVKYANDLLTQSPGPHSEWRTQLLKLIKDRGGLQ